MNQCPKESQRHGFCSKHLSQMREPINRFVGTVPHAAALPFLADYYRRRFDYVPPPSPAMPFYHPMIPPSSALPPVHPLRSFSTPSLCTSPLLVHGNPSASAFIPLIPMMRQHSVDIHRSPVSSEHRGSPSTRRLSDDDDDDDAEIDVESIPSPSEFSSSTATKITTVSVLYCSCQTLS